MPKDGRFEAPRSSIAGTAERCRTRGNSREHWEAERDDAWSEQPEFIAIRASEIPESLTPLFFCLTSARRPTHNKGCSHKSTTPFQNWFERFGGSAHPAAKSKRDKAHR